MACQACLQLSSAGWVKHCRKENWELQNLILISIYEAALTAVLSFSFDTGLIGCFYCPDTPLTTNLAICGHLMATQTSKGVSMLGKRFLRRCRCCCCCWPCSCCFRGCLTCRCSCKAHLGELHGKYAASCQWQRDHQNPAWAKTCTVAAMHHGACCASKHATQMLG